MRPLLFFALLTVCTACSHPQLASGGSIKPGAVPSTSCDGQAPVDDAVEDVPGVRASWFNDPSGNERLYVLEAGPRDGGTKPPLVLIHGVGAIGTGDYYPVLAQLSRTRRVLAIDLPGFGRSNPEDKDFGPERLARSVDTVVRTCAPGDIDVLGHSSGGSLAVLFAARHADIVRRLVLVDVAGILRPEVLLHGQLHQTLTPMREKVPLLTKAVEKAGSVMIDAVQALVPDAKTVADTGLLGDSPGVLAATALLDFNFGPALAEVRAPTKILWGEKDFVMPTRIAHLLDDRIERSELSFIPEAGHVPMKDQPDSMSKLVNDYLDGDQVPGKPHRPEPPKNVTRDGACNDQENVELTGDYDEIIVTDCKKVRLHDVRARHVIIRNSEGRLDETSVSGGLVVDDSDLIITGGELKGDVALHVSDSKLDIAGVVITGKKAAIHVHEQTEIVLSVSELHSPLTNRVMHQELKVDDDQDL